jgi:GNAT superfamily N-acetyltransferase
MTIVRRMTAEDLDFGFQLKAQAGWNQTRDDWRRFLRLQPDGCFLAEHHGQPAGVVAAFMFGPVAWIAMMLVEKSLRGRGIGRALMEHALAFAENSGAKSIRLDATPLGEPLYQRLGFTPDFPLTRYGGELPDRKKGPPFLPEANLEEAAMLDQAASGADRRRLLALLWKQQPGWGVQHEGKLQGFCTARPGSQALQIGPCIVSEHALENVGVRLFQEAFERSAGQEVIVDIPDANFAAVQAAQAAGLTARRPLLRMTRGARTSERPALIWASSGAEKG